MFWYVVKYIYLTGIQKLHFLDTLASDFWQIWPVEGTAGRLEDGRSNTLLLLVSNDISGGRSSSEDNVSLWRGQQYLKGQQQGPTTGVVSGQVPGSGTAAASKNIESVWLRALDHWAALSVYCNYRFSNLTFLQSFHCAYNQFPY